MKQIKTYNYTFNDDNSVLIEVVYFDGTTETINNPSDPRHDEIIDQLEKQDTEHSVFTKNANL